ncbi:DUF2894 domain-containing protein [Bacillus sp. NP157]|nr:DUF2894 domain-containing protein [Bacillus sp. NP157]
MAPKPTRPLGDLLDHMSKQHAATVDIAAELAAVRKLWSGVRTRSQLQQAELHMPEMESTGPLNSAALVHRAMELMRDLSPGYLQHFLSYVDDLSWMERMSAATAPAPGPATQQPAPIGTKKPRGAASPKPKAKAKPKPRKKKLVPAPPPAGA